jgi:hypothetical protein
MILFNGVVTTLPDISRILILIELLYSENQNPEAPKPPAPLDMESEDDSGLPF